MALTKSDLGKDYPKVLQAEAEGPRKQPEGPAQRGICSAGHTYLMQQGGTRQGVFFVFSVFTQACIKFALMLN
jgi:hypothetical protein